MKKIVFCLSTSLLYALPALAQRDSVLSVEIKEVVVTGERSNTYSIGSKTEKPDPVLKFFNQGQSLATLLDASSGMAIRSYGPGILATASLRGGSAQQTTLSWNGLTLNSPVNGQFDLNLIPSFLFGDVSLTPGLMGSLQGSGTIGGGINLSNNAPSQNGVAIKFFQSFGSFKNQQTGLNFQFKRNRFSSSSIVFYANGKNDFAFNNYAEPGNPKMRLQHAQSKSLNALQEFFYSTKSGANIKLGWWGNFASRQIPPTMLMAGSDAYQNDQTQKAFISIEKQRRLLHLKGKILYQYDYLKYNDSTQNQNSVSKSQMLTIDLEGRVKLGSNGYGSFGLIQINAGANSDGYQQYVSRSQSALWLSYLQNLPALKTNISASLRQELVAGTLIPIIAGIGTKTQLTKRIQLLSQWSRVYRIPTLNDLYWFPGGNLDIKAEYGYAGEVTLGYKLGNIRYFFEINGTAYSRIINRWIQWQPLSTQVWIPINIGKVRSQGIELRIKTNIVTGNNSRVGLQANADLCSSKNIDPNDINYDKQLMYVPLSKYAATLSFAIFNSSIYLGSIVVGERFTNSDNSAYLPYYYLINAGVSQEFKFRGRSGIIFFKINNITNTYYETIVWRPMPPRNFEIGIQIKI